MTATRARTTLASLLVALGTGSATATSDTTDFAWLSGAWCAEIDGTFSEEIWTAPRGGMLLGVHRDIRAGRATAFEFFRIEVRGDGATYLAQPGGRPPTAFELRTAGARSVTFANDRHDFPRRVTYERLADGRLQARVDDGSAGGRQETWTWNRCELQRGF